MTGMTVTDEPGVPFHRLARDAADTPDAHPAPGGGGAPADHWSGVIDDVRAYDRVLTAAQVRALVRRSRPASPQDR